MKINMFTKPYDGPVDISFDETTTSLKIIRPYAGVDVYTGKEWVDDRVTMVVADEPKLFWPCIIWMNKGEAKKLAKALLKASSFKYKGEDQFMAEVKSE